MESIIRFFQDGGSFMLPIGFILLMGLAVVLERFVVLIIEKQRNRSAFNEIMKSINKKDIKGAFDFAKSSKTKVGQIFSVALARIPSSSKREDIEFAIEEGMMEATAQLEKRTPYISTLANIATLLGLLGTIMGLIAAFTAVANAAPAEKATLLSESISLAMNTTAFGLMVAIPLILAHSYLQTRTNEIIDSMEMAGVKFLNAVVVKDQK